MLHGVDAAQQALARYFGTFDDFHVTAEGPRETATLVSYHRR